MTEFTHEEIGNIQVDEVNIKEYMKLLLVTLWTEGESFSGKRPFGDSGWEHSIYEALARAGAVSGKFDSEGYLDEVDTKAADRIIIKFIESM